MLNPIQRSLEAESLPGPSFRPPWYLRSGHLQTILGAVYRPKPALHGTRRHIVPLADGKGATFVYEDRPPQVDDEQSAVLLVHGLGSNHNGTYMCSVTDKLLSQGRTVIRVDLPGSGPSAGLTWLPAHAGCSDELWTILGWCHHHLGIRRWQAVGFSLGGNVLLRMMARHAEELASENARWRVENTIALAPPIDLAACCDGMERPINRWYARYFLKILNAEVRRRAERWSQWSDLAKLPRPQSIREFDERFTAPLAGFANADDYYHQSSSGSQLEAIRTPVELLCDKHDPIVPAALFSKVEGHSHIRLHWTRRGGHLGYLQRDPQGQWGRWADSWVVNRLQETRPKGATFKESIPA